MKNLEWSYIDKSNWPDGPWKQEPDKMQWTDPDTGLPCLIVRGPAGALCGYVGVEEDHPWYGIEYNQSLSGKDCTSSEFVWEDSPVSLAQVHGGITFSAFCQKNAEHGICHKVEPGDPDPVWWFGFDCAHLHDYTPKYPMDHFFSIDIYRDIAYVKEECRLLAMQLQNLNQINN